MKPVGLKSPKPQGPVEAEPTFAPRGSTPPVRADLREGPTPGSGLTLQAPRVGAAPLAPQRAPVVNGVTILGHGASAVAINEAKRILQAMIHDEGMIEWCRTENVCFEIIPKGKKLTDLEDFADLRAKRTLTGDLYDNCLGVHRSQKTNGRHVLCVLEDRLEQSAADPSARSTGLHEVAHLFHDYGEKCNKSWAKRIYKLYDHARAAEGHVFTTNYSTTNAWEYFAEHSQSAWGKSKGDRVGHARALFDADPALFGLMSEVYFGLDDRILEAVEKRGASSPLTHLGALLIEPRGRWMSAEEAVYQLKHLGFARANAGATAWGEPEAERWVWTPPGARVRQEVVLERFAGEPEVLNRLRLVTTTPDQEQVVSLDYSGAFTRSQVRAPGAQKDINVLDTQWAPARHALEAGWTGVLLWPGPGLFARDAGDLAHERMANLGPHLLDPALKAELASFEVPASSIVMCPSQAKALAPEDRPYEEAVKEPPTPNGFAVVAKGRRSVVLEKRVGRDGDCILRLKAADHALVGRAFRFDVVTPNRVQSWAFDGRAFRLSAARPSRLWADLARILEGDAPAQAREEAAIQAAGGLLPAGAGPVTSEILLRPASVLVGGRRRFDLKALKASLSERGFSQDGQGFARTEDELKARVSIEQAEHLISQYGPDLSLRLARERRTHGLRVEVDEGDRKHVRRVDFEGKIDAFTVDGNAEDLLLVARPRLLLSGLEPEQRRTMISEALRQKLVLEASEGAAFEGIITELCEDGVRIEGESGPIPLAELESLRLRAGHVNAAAFREALAGAKPDRLAAVTRAFVEHDPERIRELCEGADLDLSSPAGRDMLLENAEHADCDTLAALLDVAKSFAVDTPLDASGKTLLHHFSLLRGVDEYEREGLVRLLVARGAKPGATFEIEGEKVDALMASLINVRHVSRAWHFGELIDRGANPTARFQGRSVLDRAIAGGIESARAVLLGLDKEGVKLSGDERKQALAGLEKAGLGAFASILRKLA